MDGLRFSKPVDVTSVNAATITMRNGGPMQARVVPVENGTLAFVTPAEALKAGTEYTVLLAGVRDGNGFPLANIRTDSWDKRRKTADRHF